MVKICGDLFKYIIINFSKNISNLVLVSLCKFNRTLLKYLLINYHKYKFIPYISYCEYPKKFLRYISNVSEVKHFHDLALISINNVENLKMTIKFNNGYNEEIIEWPTSLQRVMFGKFFNQNLVLWPSNLTHLLLGQSFNKKFTSWPTSLIYLKLESYNLPLEVDASNLTTLILVNCSTILQSLPHKLKYLKALRSNLSQNIKYPSSLSHLIIDEIGDDSILKNITHLSIERPINNKLIAKSSIIYLQVRTGKLFPKVKTIDISNMFEFYSMINFDCETLIVNRFEFLRILRHNQLSQNVKNLIVYVFPNDKSNLLDKLNEKTHEFNNINIKFINFE